MKKFISLLLVISMLAGIGVVGASAEAPEGYLVSENEGDMEAVLELVATEADIAGYIGDADGDKTVNVKDASLIQKHVAKIESLTGNALLVADADLSSDVNIKDATAIQKWSAKISVSEPIFHTLYKPGEKTLDLALVGEWTETVDRADTINAVLISPIRGDEFFPKMVRITADNATHKYSFYEDGTYVSGHSGGMAYTAVIAELEEDLMVWIEATVKLGTSYVDALRSWGYGSMTELAQAVLPHEVWLEAIRGLRGTYFASGGTLVFDEDDTTLKKYEIDWDTLVLKSQDGTTTNTLKKVMNLDTAVVGEWQEDTDIADKINAVLVCPSDNVQLIKAFKQYVKIDSASAKHQYTLAEDGTYVSEYTKKPALTRILAEIESDLIVWHKAITKENGSLTLEAFIQVFGVTTMAELVVAILPSRSYSSATKDSQGTYMANGGIIQFDGDKATRRTYEAEWETMVFRTEDGAVSNTFERVMSLDTALVGSWYEKLDFADKVNAKLVSPIKDAEAAKSFKKLVQVETFVAVENYTFADDGVYFVNYEGSMVYNRICIDIAVDLQTWLEDCVKKGDIRDFTVEHLLSAMGYSTVIELARDLFTQEMYDELTASYEGTYFASEGTIKIDGNMGTYTLAEDTLTVTLGDGTVKTLTKNVSE